MEEWEVAEELELTTKKQVYEPSSSKKDNDFIGFTFGDHHSSEFGIVRTSNGSRFDENLLPTIQDKTVPVPGGDGTYYFGSYYTQRQFSIQIAFDSLTEDNLRKLKQWLGDKKIKDLIFDEVPYKVYRAKVTGSATIKHLCFVKDDARAHEEGDTRVYKGEGTIQFTCYEPFARLRKEVGSNTKEFYSANPNKYPTLEEWIKASGILTEAKMQNMDKFDPSTNTAKIYNPGDFECDFILTIKFTDKKISGRTLWIEDKDNNSLTIKRIDQKGTDFAVKVDSKSNLLIGVKEDGAMSGNTYNEYIESGHFFKIPICGEDDGLTFNIDGDSSDSKLEYRWLYF